MKKLDGGTKFVGVTLDTKSAELLHEMAKREMRTISGQVRWMIEREYTRLNENVETTSTQTARAE